MESGGLTEIQRKAIAMGCLIDGHESKEWREIIASLESSPTATQTEPSPEVRRYGT